MLRQKFQPALAAKAYPFAEKLVEPTAIVIAKRYTSPSSISCRIKKSQDAGFLVRLKNKKPRRRQSHYYYQKNGKRCFCLCPTPTSSSQIKNIIMEEPKSGWRKTKIVGMKTYRLGRIICLMLAISICLREKYLAKK